MGEFSGMITGVLSSPKAAGGALPNTWWERVPYKSQLDCTGISFFLESRLPGRCIKSRSDFITYVNHLTYWRSWLRESRAI